MDYAVSGTAVQVQQDCALAGEDAALLWSPLAPAHPSSWVSLLLLLPAWEGWLELSSGMVVTRTDVKEAQPAWAGERDSPSRCQPGGKLHWMWGELTPERSSSHRNNFSRIYLQKTSISSSVLSLEVTENPYGVSCTGDLMAQCRHSF